MDTVELVTVSDVATSVPIVAVPVDAVMFVPKVAWPEANKVPIVAVPVDAVMLEPKVTAPSWTGIVAVLIVAVEIVAVLAESVPMVAVPVDAVRLVPNVTTPESRLVPSTFKEPVLLTSLVERESAEEMSLPLVIA